MELYQEHYEDLARFARVVVRDDAAAEDITQDAFLRLYDHWHRIREPERALGYLRVTILNLARGRARRLAVARKHESELVESVQSAEDDVVLSTVQRRVLDAMQLLTDRQRDCLVLRHYAGLTESQIAAELGCSVGSVRTHAKRGMSRLAVELREVHFEGIR
ncbi:MAG TPA: sigma-70 family RNA polymerase sigma factor [Acidimicrobiia bacterium]|nr:sigma-70 family RNA polymerase sigma factor [Acidimicrobiia bacterium]